MTLNNYNEFGLIVASIALASHLLERTATD